MLAIKIILYAFTWKQVIYKRKIAAAEELFECVWPFCRVDA